jgi:hypothetical protein
MPSAMLEGDLLPSGNIAAMKRRRSAKPVRGPRTLTLTPAEIDRLYGLPPVIEPGESQPHIHAQEPVIVRCPYCGEDVHTRVDLSAGETSYIEDCQVCCQPMQLSIERTPQGTLEAVMARRMDD